MNQTFDIHLLKNAVYESASTIKELREGVKVFSKKHEVDLVTEADLRSEEILINAIKKDTDIVIFNSVNIFNILYPYLNIYILDATFSQLTSLFKKFSK